LGLSFRAYWLSSSWLCSTEGQRIFTVVHRDQRHLRTSRGQRSRRSVERNRTRFETEAEDQMLTWPLARPREAKTDHPSREQRRRTHGTPRRASRSGHGRALRTRRR
jgi:hypothetical protein